MTPILSVIIPCYNNGILLRKMIDCCRRQSLKEWELIIVDDVSTDNTFEFISNYTQDDERIIVCQRARLPKGSVVCRNIGFAIARGKYVIHFDADDLCSDFCFERRVAFMEANPEIDYASFPGVSFTAEEDLPIAYNRKKAYGIDKGYSDILESFLQGDYSFSTWNNIYRRLAIQDFLWDEKVCIYTDFSFIVPCILHGLRHAFSQVDEFDYYYRVNHSSIAMTASFATKVKHDSTLYLFRKTLNSLAALPDFLIRKRQFLQLIVLHFERLLLSGKRDLVEEYIDMLKEFYPKEILDKFLVCKESFRYKFDKIRIIHIYYSLYRQFGYSKYRTYLIHAIGKLILFR